jgi:hypothetical protein
MIRAEKVGNALYALDGLLFQSRAMAYNESDHESIAEVLNFAEYLPTLMACPEDATDEFRGFLEGLSQRHPSFGLVVDRFDAVETPEAWWR